MLYALAHPIRTVRWWRYRAACAWTPRRRAWADRWAALRARRTWRTRQVPEPAAEPEAARPERGTVIGRAFIGRDGEAATIPLDHQRNDRFDRRPPLVARDEEGRPLDW